MVRGWGCMQILRDMQGPAPMMRLLQGDVGSGKTAVAMLALLAAAGSGWQGALMAPTEVCHPQIPPTHPPNSPPAIFTPSRWLSLSLFVTCASDLIHSLGLKAGLVGISLPVLS